MAFLPPNFPRPLPPFPLFNVGFITQQLSAFCSTLGEGQGVESRSLPVTFDDNRRALAIYRSHINNLS